jgi:hypothetical protein
MLISCFDKNFKGGPLKIILVLIDKNLMELTITAFGTAQLKPVQYICAPLCNIAVLENEVGIRQCLSTSKVGKFLPTLIQPK